jgi:hypothetical protein
VIRSFRHVELRSEGRAGRSLTLLHPCAWNTDVAAPKGTDCRLSVGMSKVVCVCVCV